MTPSRRRLARLASVVHAAIAAWCIVRSIRISGDPMYYYRFHRDPSAFVFPAHDVAVWCSAIGVEVVVAAWLMQLASSLAFGALVTALLFGGAVLVLGVFTMHAPPYFAMHVLFVLCSAGWWLVVSIAAALIGPGEPVEEPAAPRRAVHADDL